MVWNYPFYYSLSDLLAGYYPFNNMLLPIESDTALTFRDVPTLSGGDGLTQFIVFETHLVGVSVDGSIVDLASFTWTDSFNGTAGGIGGWRSNYSLSVDPGSGSGGVTITSINGVPQTPPSVSCSATPNSLWPPNGKSVVVTVSGIITPGTQDIPSDGTTYAVTDEYGQVQPTGNITLAPGGSYSFGVPLVASRDGNDRDGRTYVIVVRAADNLGNVGTCSATVTVPHDQGP